MKDLTSEPHCGCPTREPSTETLAEWLWCRYGGGDLYDGDGQPKQWSDASERERVRWVTEARAVRLRVEQAQRDSPSGSLPRMVNFCNGTERP